MSFAAFANVATTEMNLLPHPFDLSVIPENLEVDDPLPQSVAQDAVLSMQLGDVDESARFYAQTPTFSTLGSLRRIYERTDKAKASSLLSSRHRVQYDHSDYVTPSNSDNVRWSVDRHYIDMLVCVGRDIGLGAIIPNQVMNSLYSIQLNFRHRSKEFRAKHNRLGFDPTGCMLWIGNMPSSSDDIWIAWAQENSDEEDNTIPSNTCLSEQHYRIGIMFFAFVLSKCGYRDVVVHNQYPDISTLDAVNEATNFLYVDSNIMTASISSVRTPRILPMQSADNFILLDPATYAELLTNTLRILVRGSQHCKLRTVCYVVSNHGHL